MNKQQILNELNVQLQIVRVNSSFWLSSWKARDKANERIDVLTDKLEKSNP